MHSLFDLIFDHQRLSAQQRAGARLEAGDHALLLGRYDLDREQPDHGFFSLVLARQRGRIVILHDHTSADRPADLPLPTALR